MYRHYCGMSFSLAMNGHKNKQKIMHICIFITLNTNCGLLPELSLEANFQDWPCWIYINLIVKFSPKRTAYVDGPDINTTLIEQISSASVSQES